MQADYKAAYLVKELKRKNQYLADHFEDTNDSIRQIMAKDLNILREEISKELLLDTTGIQGLAINKALTLEGYNKNVTLQVETYLEKMQKKYRTLYNRAVDRKEAMASEKEQTSDYNLNKYKDKYFNESLSDLVRNITETDRVLEYRGKLLRQIDPIYHNPEQPGHILDYRTHFFAPKKYFLGNYYDTYYFNILVIWFMSVIFYVTLYFELLRKALSSTGKIKLFGKGV